MTRFAETILSRRLRSLAAIPLEGRLCLAASGGCLSVGAIGWMLGTAVPALRNLGALMVVGVLYLVLAVPSLMSLMRPQRTGEAAAGAVAVAADRPRRRGKRRNRRARSAA